jgi:hypothetical protein
LAGTRESGANPELPRNGKWERVLPTSPKTRPEIVWRRELPLEGAQTNLLMALSRVKRPEFSSTELHICHTCPAATAPFFPAAS